MVSSNIWRYQTLLRLPNYKLVPFIKEAPNFRKNSLHIKQIISKCLWYNFTRKQSVPIQDKSCSSDIYVKANQKTGFNTIYKTYIVLLRYLKVFGSVKTRYTMLQKKLNSEIPCRLPRSLLEHTTATTKTETCLSKGITTWKCKDSLKCIEIKSAKISLPCFKLTFEYKMEIKK